MHYMQLHIKWHEKHALHINFTNGKFSCIKEIFKEQEILSMYQFNILGKMIFMQRLENKTSPPIISIRPQILIQQIFPPITF